MRIHHLAFRTRDLPTLETFYTSVLGLVVTRRAGDDSVWLDAGGTILMLERAAPDEPLPPHGAMDLCAFAIAAAARCVHEARLEAAGVRIEARTDFTLYIRDPDGRRVAVSHYPEPAPRDG